MSPIHERCRPDGVREFRAAAVARYDDGVLLAGGPPEHWLMAVYLWGYSTEMVLKAAVFGQLGNTAVEPINAGDLKAIQQLAKSAAEFTWAGNLHSLHQWAAMLVRCRWRLGAAYPDPVLGRTVIARSQRVYDWWRETLRYHVLAVTPAELAAAREQARWFVDRVESL